MRFGKKKTKKNDMRFFLVDICCLILNIEFLLFVKLRIKIKNKKKKSKNMKKINERNKIKGKDK